jgi:hypothetical protein
VDEVIANEILAEWLAYTDFGEGKRAKLALEDAPEPEPDDCWAFRGLLRAASRT